MTKRVHHVFVRDLETSIWHHENAFADRDDAIFERDDYRDKPTTGAARVVAGPDSFPFIRRKLDELNAREIADCLNRNPEIGVLNREGVAIYYLSRGDLLLEALDPFGLVSTARKLRREVGQ